MPALHPPLRLRGDCRVGISFCNGNSLVFLKLLGPRDMFPGFLVVDTGVPGTGESPGSFLFEFRGLVIPGPKIDRKCC